MLTLLAISILVPSLGSAARTPAQSQNQRPDADKVMKAQSMAAEGKVDQAAKILQDAIKQEKDANQRSLLRMALGIIYFQATQDAAATEQLTKAIEDGSRIPDYANYHLGILHAKLGTKESSEDARREFERVIDSKPPKATENDAHFQLAQLFIRDQKWSQARNELEKLKKSLRNDQRYPEVLYYLAHVERLSERRAQSCKWARELYSKFPNHYLITAKQNWGPKLAENTIENLPTGCSWTNKDLTTRIRRLWLGGNDQKAEDELRSLSSERDEEGNSVVDTLLANHLISAGRLDEALKLILKRYDENKDKPAYFLLLAKASSAAGEYQAAIAAYSRAYELAPRGKNGSNALFQAAFTSYLIQDYDGAFRRFEQLAKVDGSSKMAGEARWYLAWIRYLRGDYVGAQESFASMLRVPEKKSRRGGRNRKRVQTETVSASRLKYWSAVSLVKMGKAEQSVLLFQELARDPSIDYYSMLAYYRLRSIPGAKIPPAVETRLGLRKSGPSAVPTEEELKEATKTLAQDAAQEFAKDETSAGQPDEAEVAEESSEAVASSDDEESETAPDGAEVAVESVMRGDNSFKEAAVSVRFERARDLAFVGLEDAARRELKEVERRVRSASDRKLLIVEYANVESFERSSYMGEVGFGSLRLRDGMKGEGRSFWEFAYPRAWDTDVVKASNKTSVPEELIWGIMRAESHFKQDAQSPVGAMGLMQLMPFTGRKVASLMNISSFEPRTLLDPQTNISLGSRYLQRLLEKFSGRVPLVAASYNAGPHRVHAWVKNFGSLDMDEFIEHIPFVETRNYTKRVVRNYQIYSLLYRGSGARPLSWLIEPVGVQLSGPHPAGEVW